MSDAAIRGVVGLLKWQYYVAARVEGYRITRVGGRWTLTATVVEADAFKLSRRPLRFLAPHEKGAWEWPVRDYELRDRTALTAELGPPLELTR